MIMSTENEIAVIKLTKDLKAVVGTMTRNQARYLVDSYYQMQDNRMRAGGQISAMERGLKITNAGIEKGEPEPHAVLDWLKANAEGIENQIKAALKCYAESQPMGKWAMQVAGIGPVIAAALVAHIDIEKAITVGKVWRFAGLDPTSEWKKGEKRPFCAALKVVCWKIGESFVKSGKLYRKLYDDRKTQEIAKNEAGLFAEQAKAKLEKFKIGKSTEAYKAYSVGKLPPGHIHARAKRYAVKMFLSHWWEQAWWYRFGCEPVKPFGLTMEGHGHYVDPEVPIVKEKI